MQIWFQSGVYFNTMSDIIWELNHKNKERKKESWMHDVIFWKNIYPIIDCIPLEITRWPNGVLILLNSTVLWFRVFHHGGCTDCEQTWEYWIHTHTRTHPRAHTRSRKNTMKYILKWVVRPTPKGKQSVSLHYV